MAEELVMNIKSNIKGVTKDTDKLGQSMGKVSEETKKTSGETTKLTEAQKKQNLATQEGIGNFQVMGLSLNAIKGAFGKIIPTAKAMFGTIKAGVMSTGIGALLIGFLTLRQYFTDNEEGASKLKIITSALGVVFGNITDILSNLGKKLFETFSNPKKAILDLWNFIKTNLMNRLTGLTDSFVAAGKVIQAAINLDFEGVREGMLDLGESMAQVATGVDDVFNKTKDGINSTIEAVKEFGEQTRKEVAQSTQLEKDRLALQKFERTAIVEKARTEKDMMKLRVQARDFENETAENRLQFMRQANKMADEQLKKDLHVAREKLRFRVEENTFSKSSKENLDEEAQLKAAVFQLERSNWSERKRLKSEEQAIVKEIAAAEKFAASSKLKADKLNIKAAEHKLERLKGETDEELIIRIAAAKTLKEAQIKSDAVLLALQQGNSLALIENLQERALAELKIQEDKEIASAELMENSEAIKEEIRTKFARKRNDIDKKFSKDQVKWSEMTADQQMSIAHSTAGSLSKILGEETAAGKAMAITQATIDTYKGATSAYASMSGIPVVGPALGAVAAAAAIAAGIANVKAITSASSSGPSGGGGNVSPPSAPQSPAPQMMSGAFELGGGLEPDPVKTFVVTDEMSSSQNQLANIRRQATI